MEKYILNRKLLYLIKNKEFDFFIPVSIDTRYAESLVECPDLENENFGIKVMFNFSKDSQKLSKQITLTANLKYFDLKTLALMNKVSICFMATESVNLTLTIKETSH